MGQAIVGGLLHQCFHAGVAELALRLALKLRIAQLDADDRRQALTDVLTAQVVVFFLNQRFFPGIFVHHRGQGCFEPLDMSSALNGGNAVGKAVEALVVPGVPLQSHLGLTNAVFVDDLERRDLGEQRFFRGIEVLDEVLEAIGELEHMLGRHAVDVSVVLGALIHEPYFQSSVEKRHHPESFQQGFGPKFGGFEDQRVWPEGDCGARSTPW